MVEGHPTLEDIIKILKEDNFFQEHKKIILKPFMITAGDHAHRDINGSSEESWKSRLTSCGFDVEVVMEGLGSNPSIAKIFAKRISETAVEHQIDLSSKEM